MELILHLGAHRTGSTAFETMLVSARSALAGQGVAVWPNARVRRIAGFQEVASDGATDAAQAAFAATWAGESADRLVICEENILGTMLGNLMAGALYPDLAEQLARYAALFSVQPRRIGLGIRDLAWFWASSLSFVARRRWVPDWADTASRIVASPRGWADVVADLRAAFPSTEIVLWTHGTDLPRVAERLTDLPPGLLVAPAERVNAAHELGYLPAILRLRAEHPDMTEANMRAALSSVTPDPSHAPFIPAQRAALDARYAHDLALLRQGHADAILLG